MKKARKVQNFIESIQSSTELKTFSKKISILIQDNENITERVNCERESLSEEFITSMPNLAAELKFELNGPSETTQKGTII